MFDKLLVPIDFAEPPVALKNARAIARRFGAETVLLHVVPPMISNRPVDVDQALPAQRAKLDELARDAFDGARSILLHGDPARMIVETAARENVKLIACHPRAPIGSVTAVVLAFAAVPVWSCPDSLAREDLDVCDVLCGVDFTPHDHPTIDWAKAMTKEFGARLTLVHATPSAVRFGPGGHLERPELAKRYFDEARVRMHELARDVTTVECDTRIVSGDIADVLSELSDESGHALVVIARRPANGMLGGSAQRILEKAHAPALAV